MLKRRIENDITKLQEYETMQPIQRKIKVTNNDIYPYIIQINDNITITITKKYPFNAPIVHIGKQSYIQFLIPQNKNIRQIYETILHKCCCLWCESILHPNNWMPTKNLFSILLEIEQFNKLKQRIKQILLYNRYLKIICNQYNLPMHSRDLTPYLYTY